MEIMSACCCMQCNHKCMYLFLHLHEYFSNKKYFQCTVKVFIFCHHFIFTLTQLYMYTHTHTQLVLLILIPHSIS